MKTTLKNLVLALLLTSTLIPFTHCGLDNFLTKTRTMVQNAITRGFCQCRRKTPLQDPAIQKLVSQDAAKKVVIFDVGGVLLNLHTTKMGIKKVGLWGFVHYLASHCQTPGHIKKSVLELYRSQETTALEKKHSAEHAHNYDGSPLPNLINEFQCGKKTLDECLKLITERSNTLYTQKKYASKAEKDLILALATTPFESKKFAEHTSIIKPGVQLLQKCAQAGHTIMILSNWDKYSFEFLKQKYHQEIFQYVKPEHIFVSGAIKHLKPSAAAYEYVLKIAACDAADCVFFDDQPENILGAQQLGIQAIHYKF